VKKEEYLSQIITNFKVARRRPDRSFGSTKEPNVNGVLIYHPILTNRLTGSATNSHV
jgi:hypothetical protein